MNKLKRLHIKELIICLILCVIPIYLGVSHVQHFEYTESLFPKDETDVIASRIMHNGVETIEVKDKLRDISGGQLYMSHYSIPGGDVVVSGSLRGKTEDPVVLQSLHIVGDATIHFLENGVSKAAPLTEGSYSSSLYLIDSDSFDIACYTPKEYKFLEYEALEYLPKQDGYLNVKKTDDGFDLELVSKAVDENCCSDFMIVHSEHDLVNWDEDILRGTWLYFTMDGENRWTYTGYYRKSPTTYYPNGENVFHRCQACYMGASFINAESRDRAMEDMLCCIVDTMAQQQNEYGFFPSTSMSLWLHDDYNVNAPYYDTRFNSDLIEIFLNCYDVYSTNSAYLAIEDYLDFYMNYAASYGRSDGNGGIWIPDYWDEQCDISNIHTSLNHQLSELIVLYRMAELFNNNEAKTLADQMLKAIENTGVAWVKENNDLWYCINTDGSFARQDYDELTYNDMYKLQLMLESKGQPRNSVIDRLMRNKLIWMIDKGVTTYFQ